MVLIIGITGTLGAGKGTIVEFLKTKGFNHYSVSGAITEDIKKRGLPVNIDSMVLVGNEQRAKYGPSYYVERLYEKAKKNDGDCIIESIRTLGEINSLKKKGAFYLFAVDADIKIRYSRIIKRKSAKDNLSFEEFLSKEKTQMNTTDPNKQNLSKCIKRADFIFENEGTIDELNYKVEAVIDGIRKRD